MIDIQYKSKKIRQILSLTTSLVGIKFYFTENYIPKEVQRLKGYRYCQALMKARHGMHALIDAEGIACPAASAAFGFKKLPEGLETGKGLVGFGIVKQEHIGRKMFEGMTILPRGKLKALYLYPLETAQIEPDVIVVEGEPEQLMWIALANLNAKDGHRIESNTAILQATCVDATIIPYINQKLNMSMGCYGCRDASDLASNETVLGFPFKDFYEIAEYIEFLNEKAIPSSRSKNALKAINHKDFDNES